MYKPGDKVKIKRGPYKGMKGILKRHCDEYDMREADKYRRGWTVWINNVIELVYEDELEITK